jgi:putative DNA primase/helicase
MLAGARFCMTTETEQGQAWAEKRLKELTGGDPISARYMRCDFFQFTPQFKLTVSGNHKPALRNVDAAARRRFNLLPFVHKPEVVDQLLPEKLKAEWPGILRWMIDGCMEWQARGLMPPESVRMATEEYFEDQDTIGKWLTDRCDLAPGNEATPKELQDDCRQWALTNGEAIATPDQLKAALGCVAGVKYRRGNARRWWQGIALKPRENSGVNLDDLMKAA